MVKLTTQILSEMESVSNEEMQEILSKVKKQLEIRKDDSYSR